MPCCLSPSTTAKEDFTAVTGCVVTLDMRGPAGAGAEIVNIRYDEAEVVSAPPFRFTVRAGADDLVVLTEASAPGALVQLIEICDDGAEQVIDRFQYVPEDPVRTYIVRGLAS